MAAKKVLIADDDQSLVELLKWAILRQGYDTVTAYNGQEALTCIQQEKPDLVILDLMMPNVDGYHVLQKVMFEEIYLESVPKFIVLTARSADLDKGLAEQIGAVAYMVKPFNMDLLLQKIKELIG